MEENLPIIEVFPPTKEATYVILVLMQDSSTLTSSAILMPFQGIASCIHLNDFLRNQPREEHKRFNLYYESASVISSVVSGGMAVVNPMQFTNHYRSHHDNINANEGTYCDNWINQLIYL